MTVSPAGAGSHRSGEELRTLVDELEGDWRLVGEHHLETSYSFPDFATAYAFVQRVAEMSEAQGHHGDISLAWGRVGLSVWTHTIDGLTESDFIWAAKAEALHSAGLPGGVQ